MGNILSAKDLRERKRNISLSEARASLEEAGFVHQVEKDRDGREFWKDPSRRIGYNFNTKDKTLDPQAAKALVRIIEAVKSPEISNVAEQVGSSAVQRLMASKRFVGGSRCF